MWSREVLHGELNHRRIDGKDGVGGSILGTATGQSGIARLDVLADQADDGFPLDTAAVDELLRGLQARLVAIYQDEVAARDELRAILA